MPISGVSVGDTRFEQGSLIAGRYLVERELGRGGMGVVYLVRDQRLHGKELALKLIASDLLASPQGSDRFAREVLAAQELQHPNIVRVYHLDEVAGQSFFTMEYVPGTSLREIIEDRKREGRTFTLEECLSVLVPVLEALQHAHAQSSPVIHRDIKPDNIMVAGDLSSPQVKVLDFGLAKMLSPSRLTTTAMTMGTAYYMAPEQVQGARDIDQRADLFSVGVILYEMLTGQVPSGRFRLPAELNAHLPSAIDVVIDRALQQNPKERHVTALELLTTFKSAARVDESSTLSAAKPHQFAQHDRSVTGERRVQSWSRTATKMLSGVLVLGAMALLAFFLLRGEQELSVSTDSAPESTPVQEMSANDSTPVNASSQAESKGEAEVLAPVPPTIQPTDSLVVPSSTDKDLVTMDGKELVETPSTTMQADAEAAGSEQDLTLEAEAFGHLFVNTVPKDATIKIFPIKDKFEQGMALKPGRYELRISAPGHVERNEKVEIAAEEEKRLDFELQKALGELDIDSNEAGAWVHLSGTRLGAAPGKYSDIPIGRHELRVTKEGFEPWVRNVDILPGEKVVLSVSLEKIKPVPGQIWREPVTGMEFVWVPAGCFDMGSRDGDSEPDEQIVHKVCVSGFWMGRYEVTNVQYRQFKPVHVSNKYSGASLNEANQPVASISWYDARAYAEWLSSKNNGSFRLPTEAEWEYAARSGGKSEKYAGGNDAERVAWYNANSRGRSREVGTKNPNTFGLFDMSGNVWEWCEDAYGSWANVKGPQNNPVHRSGDARVVRGGSWINGRDFVRATNRDWSDPGTSRESQGFRLVRTE